MSPEARQPERHHKPLQRRMEREELSVVLSLTFSKEESLLFLVFGQCPAFRLVKRPIHLIWFSRPLRFFVS